MKTIFKVRVMAEDWKTVSAIYTAKKDNAKGGKYTGGEAMTFVKALKRVKETLKAQNRAFTERAEGEFVVIEANQ